MILLLLGPRRGRRLSAAVCLLLALFLFIRIGASEGVVQRLFRLLQLLHDLAVPLLPLVHPEQPAVHEPIRVRHDELDDQRGRVLAHARDLVLERGDRRARDGEALLGELDGEVAEPAEDGEDFGADVGGEVERALEEQVVQPVELLLRLVRVAREVLGARELADEMADDLHDGHSHRIRLAGSCAFA